MDMEIQNLGDKYIVRPITTAAQDWLRAHIVEDVRLENGVVRKYYTIATQAKEHLNEDVRLEDGVVDGVVVERRDIAAVFRAIHAAGLETENMNRERIIKNYHIENGIIQDPGKFQGQMLYVPYFYDKWAWRDGDVGFFVVNDSHRWEFPELDGVHAVALEELDDGSVHARVYWTEQEYENAVRADDE